MIGILFEDGLLERAESEGFFKVYFLSWSLSYFGEDDVGGVFGNAGLGVDDGDEFGGEG